MELSTDNKITKQRQSEPIVDILVKNLYDMSNHSSNCDMPLLNFEVIAKLVPDANPEYISHRLAIMRSRSNFEKKLEDEGCKKDVQGFVYSLLQKNKEKDNQTSDEYAPSKYQPIRNFELDSMNDNPEHQQNKQHGKDQVSSPNMVIHVCDEAKNLKQDFECPRDLLINEMQYFAEYLSIDAQRLEEVDISVHCDIHIFDWLMRYVKRDTKLIEESDIPRLDPNNVISILISSDFLKMDSLVEACINYCHKNMSLIVSTPCNMNCVNEKLTSLIAMKFSHSELEEVKDRKDKFKSKLFCKKIEMLFDQNAPDCDSTGKASSLFKCAMCQRVLTAEQSMKLTCTNNRLNVNSYGGLSYNHEHDNSWDVNNYLISLFEELRKWNLVYWRLWGIVNHLTCSRCIQTFQLCDFGNCLYHPDRAQYHNLSLNDSCDNPLGVYPCCNQHVLRFDPTGINKGCRMKEHVVTTTDAEERRRLDDLLTHKNLIKTSIPVTNSSSDLNIFASEEIQCSIKEATMTPVEFHAPLPPVQPPAQLPKKKLLPNIRSSPDNGEEDVAGEEDLPMPSAKRSQISISLDSPSQYSLLPVSYSGVMGLSNEPASRSNPIGTKKKDKIKVPSDSTMYKVWPSKQRWDAARSVRWNQDMQREEDRRRLTSIATNLTKQRSNDKMEKIKIRDHRELPGGLFMKLEQAFFNNLKIQVSTNPQGPASSRQYSLASKDLKVKLRR